MKIGFALLLSVLLTASGGVNAGASVPLAAGETPVPGSTEAELWYGMDQAEKDIKQSPYLVRDEALNAYVRDVLCRVTDNYCAHIRLYVVDVPVFNASMAPNGVMLVFTGALLRMQDESELAVLLGHEFAHYRQRHSLQQWESTKRTTAFLASFGVLTWAGGVGIVGGIAQMAGLANIMQFSRDSERESDRIGFDIIANKGYDPEAGVRMWQRIQREEAADKTRKQSTVFASHPKTMERIEDMRIAANAHKGKASSRFQERYAQAITPFLAKWLDAEISKRTYTTSIQVIREKLEAGEPNLVGTFEFYLGETYRRRNRDDDRLKAENYYAQAVTRTDAPVAAYREHGLALKKAGNARDALIQLQRYLNLMPNASDRLFIEKDIAELEKSP